MATTAQQLLDDRTYHIEFNGYLSNHVKHAIIALAGLQAPDDVLQKYWNEYTKLTLYGFELEAAKPPDPTPVTEDNWKDLLGKKENFSGLEQFFRSELAQHGLDGVLQRYAPELLPGSAGALTHGIIHLGWAIDAGNETMIVEGLAYMVFSFVDVHPERFQQGQYNESTPMQSLLRAASDFKAAHVDCFVSKVKDDPKYSLEAGFHTEIYKAGFQWQVAKVLEEGHPLFLSLPSWLDDLDVQTALQQLYRALTLLYLVTAGEPADSRGPGSFLALHALTSLWGAEHVLKHLPEDTQRFGLKCMWAMLLGTLCASAAGLPEAAKLEATREKYDSAVDAKPSTEPLEPLVMPGTEGAAVSGDTKDVSLKDSADVQADWLRVLERAWVEDEEHNIKLVYVMRELWRRDGHWSAFRVAADTFTATPDIGPGRERFGA